MYNMYSVSLAIVNHNFVRFYPTGWKKHLYPLKVSLFFYNAFHSVIIVNNPYLLLRYRRPWCEDQEDCESGHSDHDQRQGGGWVQWGGADRGA